MNIQKWNRIKFYPSNYLDQVYKYWAGVAPAYYCTYFQTDLVNSILDKTKFEAGSYDNAIGKWSGIKWHKILNFPMYNTEQIQKNFIADETGFGKSQQVSTFVFPSFYNVTPFPENDFIFFEETSIDQDRINKGSLFQITHSNRAVDGQYDFWKVNIEVSPYLITDINNYLSGTFEFVEYEKRIYPDYIAVNLNNMIERNKSINMNPSYKEHVGFYFGV